MNKMPPRNPRNPKVPVLLKKVRDPDLKPPHVAFKKTKAERNARWLAIIGDEPVAPRNINFEKRARRNQRSEARQKRRAERPKRGDRPPKKILEYIEITGYNAEDSSVGTITVDRASTGAKLTPRKAVRTLRAQGAVSFYRQPVFRELPT